MAVPAAHVLAMAAALAVAVAPARLRGQPDSGHLIIPGRAIGLVGLGMTAAQVHALASSLPCEVAVAYASGRAARLETNCGAAYVTADGITVGLDGSRIWWVHGRPDATVPSHLAGTRAEWLLYQGAGIGYRVIYGDGGPLIQAIAIFRGTTAPGLRRPPAAPPVAPPPAVGD